MNEPDSSQTIFWTKRWESGKTPWDLGGVPPALAAYLHRTHTATTALIPGCGTGYEVRAFHEMGYDVSAIEFSAPAVAHAREVLGLLGERVIHGNFFKHEFAGKQFGLIYERGFLCPRRRRAGRITRREWQRCCREAESWSVCFSTATSRSRRHFP